MNNDMFNKILTATVVVVIIILIVYQYDKEKKHPVSSENMCPECPVCQVCPVCEPDKQSVVIDVNKNPSVPPLTDIAREYDYRALSDPLVPPYKRDDYQIPLPAIPTRGYPSSFKKMGLLIDSEAENSDKYKFMLLMGRQKYPGATYYDYYITENKPDSALKFDLPNLHKEIYSDDVIRLDELSKNYKVKIDRNLGFDYNPFVF